MTYNKSEIMKKAWAMYKAAKRNAKGTKEYNFKTKKFETAQVKPFSAFLKGAWAEAKRAAAAIESKKVPVTIQEQITIIEKNLFSLSMKDHWNNSDYEQDRLWRDELRELNKQLKPTEAVA